MLLHAGDVATIDVEVHSSLGEPLPLNNVVICLTIVGEDSLSGERSMTSMVDGTCDPTFALAGADLPKSRLNRMRSMQDPPTDKLQKTSLQLFCTVQGDQESVVLQPGVTELSFQCCPIREGFYALMYLTGEYLGTSLCLPLKQEGNVSHPSWTICHPKKRYHLTDALGYLSPALHEAVVLHVEPALQRMEVIVVLPQGCLVSSQSQWLGLVLKGQHTADIQHGTLTVAVTHPSNALHLPQQAHITNKSINDTDGIDAWIAIDDGRITLPPGFLYRGMLAIWMLMDLTPVTSVTRQISADLSRLEHGCDFECRPDASLNLEGTVHFQTQLEYFLGCWRSHASLINVPLWSPFCFESNFIKMNATSMLVTVRLASQLPVRCEIESIQLELFCPRKQNCRPALIGPFFPTALHPAEVMNIAFRLTKNEAKILAASARESDEQMVTGEFSMSYKTRLFDHHKPLQSSGTDAILANIVFPPAEDDAEMIPSEQTCHFRCPLELDVLMGGEGPKNDLFRISLLPPPAIIAGTPIALTWMLERSGSLHSKESIAYEILPESGWQACVPLHGSVYVPLSPSASATLEAMFIAVSEGELQAPRLVLTQNKIQSPLVILKVTSSSANQSPHLPFRNV